METLEELMTHVTVLWDPKARRYHWLYGNAVSYCGLEAFASLDQPYRVRILADLPTKRHVCRDCRHAATVLAKGKKPSITQPEN